MNVTIRQKLKIGQSAPPLDSRFISPSGEIHQEVDKLLSSSSQYL